ncbi:MAG: glycerophosphodiester phosphodiesterase family protein [Eubacterium sp.]
MKAEASKSKAKGKKSKKGLKALLAVVIIIGVLAAAMTAAGNYKSDPSTLKSYEADNQYILESTDISAHRSGSGIAPEETMTAFKNCVESTDFEIDVFEFDLHITKDDVLVLLHDDTLDRTSDSQEVFGEEEVRPEDKTYEELRILNMGAKFETDSGEMPYSNLKGDQVSDDLKILRVEDVLDYLMSNGDYKYIIEIKNGGDLGKKGVDILHEILAERNLLDKVIFGTFHGEISEYVDKNYPDMTRSTGIKEALEFWLSALTNKKDYEPPCGVLQIPYCAPYKNLGINTGTTRVINYAHQHNMAVQYWTVDDEEDMEYLISIGADCIMSDYPDRLYEIKNNK